MNFEGLEIISRINLLPIEERLEKKLKDLILEIKYKNDNFENRKKRIKFEQFKEKIEKDGSMCLLFTHESLPSQGTPKGIKPIYYEYLILNKNGNHDSLCSRVYSSDTQENRLHALESFYYKFNIEETQKDLLKKEYIEYNEIYNRLIKRIFYRVMCHDNHFFKIIIKKYTYTPVMYEQLEIKLFPSNKTFQSECYPISTFSLYPNIYEYEKVNLFLIILNLEYK